MEKVSQNSIDLINQQKTSGAEDTELTWRPKSSKVCTLQLDISWGLSLAKAHRKWLGTTCCRFLSEVGRWDHLNSRKGRIFFVDSQH